MKKILNISFLRIILLALPVSFIMMGCGTEDVEKLLNGEPTVKIDQKDKVVNVGTTVDLTGSASDGDNEKLTLKWSFTSKPTGSSATLTTDTTEKTSFVADKVGKYVIKFLATNESDKKSSKTITITAKEVGNVSNTCNGYTEISGSYTTDKTLSGCYKVVGDISVGNNALLTIEKGSTLVFADSTGLTIGQKGALKAVGTSEQPILFTSEQPTAGYWDGLRFSYSNNVKNELEYVTVEYGGGNDYANLLLDASTSSPCRLKISNSTLKNSLYHGFWFDDGSIIEFSNVTSTKNGESAGGLYASNLYTLDSDSNFTGNTKDSITLKGSTLRKDGTWQQLTVPIHVVGDISIPKNLTIKDGSTFVFSSSSGFTVSSAGSLIAKGTKSKPILFTGEQETAGYWEGLRFSYSNNIKNELDYITIQYGGGNSYANLLLDASTSSPCRLKVNRSTFANSSKYGIWLDKGSITNNDIATSNTFTNNANGTLHQGN